MLKVLPYEVVLEYHRKKAVIATASSADPSTALQSLTEVQTNAISMPSAIVANEFISSVSSIGVEQLINIIQIKMKVERGQLISGLDMKRPADNTKPISVASGFALLIAESSQTLNAISLNQQIVILQRRFHLDGNEERALKEYEVFYVNDAGPPVSRLQTNNFL